MRAGSLLTSALPFRNRLPADAARAAGLHHRRTRWLVAASLVAGAGAVLAGVGLMSTSGYLISRAAQRPPILDLILLFVAVRFFGFLRPALRYAERLASHDVTFRVLLSLRCWFYESLLPLSPARLLSFRSGDLLHRVADDVESLQEAYLRITAPAVVAAVVGLVVVTALAVVDTRLAVAVLLLLVLNGIAVPLMARRVARGVGERRNAERSALAAHLVTMVQGLEDAQAFGYERALLARAGAHQGSLDAIERRYGRRLAANAAIGTALANAALWTALALTVGAAMSGAMPGVWIAALVLGVLAAFEAVEPLPNAWQFREQVEDAGRRVLDVIHTVPAVADDLHPVSLPKGTAPAVAFEHVTFGFDGRDVLQDFSMRLAPGAHALLTGSTGSGKSTVLGLLMRIWDPRHGRITIDGIDVRRVPLRELRATMAVLPQQVHVFNETLRENLRLARPSATDADLVDALRAAGLERFLAGLPEGLETRLGEHGARMSAGERQRLGLARVLLTDARLVLVDEPTANLDGEHARAVFAALSAWARGRTMIVATHGVRSRFSKAVPVSLQKFEI